MAYRNTALGLVSLVAITVACGKSDYDSKPTFAGQIGSATQDSEEDHGAADANGITAPAEPKVAADQTAKQAPAVPNKPVATPPPAAGAPSAEDKFKAMLAAGKVMNTVTIEPGKSLAWGTSTAARLEVLVAVDAAGAPIVPAGIQDRQIPSGTPAAPEDTKFQANGADVATMNSSLRVCNNSGEAIYLHSGNAGPFSHGDGPIANATCVQFLAQRAAATDGATYDHTDGNNIANYVYLKVTKIGPDGKIVP